MMTILNDNEEVHDDEFGVGENYDNVVEPKHINITAQSYSKSINLKNNHQIYTSSSRRYKVILECSQDIGYRGDHTFIVIMKNCDRH